MSWLEALHTEREPVASDATIRSLAADRAMHGHLGRSAGRHPAGALHMRQWEQGAK